MLLLQLPPLLWCEAPRWPIGIREEEGERYVCGGRCERICLLVLASSAVKVLSFNDSSSVFDHTERE